MVTVFSGSCEGRRIVCCGTAMSRDAVCCLVFFSLGVDELVLSASRARFGSRDRFTMRLLLVDFGGDVECEFWRKFWFVLILVSVFCLELLVGLIVLWKFVGESMLVVVLEVDTIIRILFGCWDGALPFCF
jgi:hypothetical protein